MEFKHLSRKNRRPARSAVFLVEGGDSLGKCHGVSAAIREIQELFALYPAWLVAVCMVIVGCGVAVFLGKVVRWAAVAVLVLAGLAGVAFLLMRYFQG